MDRWIPDLASGARVNRIVIVGVFHLAIFFVNAYLSKVVRLQDDRGQEVVSTGVSGFVRHPMYLGAALFFIC